MDVEIASFDDVGEGGLPPEAFYRLVVAKMKEPDCRAKITAHGASYLRACIREGRAREHVLRIVLYCMQLNGYEHLSDEQRKECDDFTEKYSTPIVQDAPDSEE